MPDSRRTLTHVLQCSNRRAELLEEERVVSLSAAKVYDLDDIHVGDDDVLWLDVQVEDASGMEVVQTLEDLHDVGHHIVLGVTEPERKQLVTGTGVSAQTNIQFNSKGFTCL